MSRIAIIACCLLLAFCGDPPRQRCKDKYGDGGACAFYVGLTNQNLKAAFGIPSNSGPSLTQDELLAICLLAYEKDKKCQKESNLPFGLPDPTAK